MTARKVVCAALAALHLWAPLAQAKVMVVAEVTASADYAGSNTLNTLVNRRALHAVRTVLDRYGADYRIVPKGTAKTEFCRIGVLTHNFGTAGAYTEEFDAVIHVGFNGNRASTPTTPYRPDSLTLTAAAPSVPQLFLVDDILGVDQGAAFVNGTADSTWVDTDGYLGPGSGTGNHEGEGSVFSPDNDFRWFDATFGSHILKKAGSPTGGMRVLLAGGANATLTNLNLTGNMPTFPDSLSTATADTMKVWEKLNAHKSGVSRITFATAFAQISADSIGGGANNTYDAIGVNWPVLLYAMAHLDSLSGGAVLGRKKAILWGAIITGGGTTSDRRHPGGFFLADSNIVAASCDSVGTLNARVVVAADPESLATRPWQVAIFNRMKTVRYAPWVRHGLDTLALEASGAVTLEKPIDVWGRYRNRAIMGDSANHTVTGSDSSVYANISAARKLLSAQVGQNRLSTTLIAPDNDWSPYQMRRGQNAIKMDSILCMTALLGGPLVVNVQDRDRDPAYSGTNPKGWNIKEGRYKASTSTAYATVLGHNGMTVMGSQKGAQSDGLSFSRAQNDSVAPYLDSDPGPNTAVYEENRFWNGLFGPSRDYHFTAYDGADRTNHGVYTDARDILYANSKASLIVLPAQSLGGQDINGPNRWGFFVLKHLIHATRAINAKAGRVIIDNAYPEEIRP